MHPHLKRAEQLFSCVFLALFDLSRFCFLSYLGTEGNYYFILSFHSEFTFLHTLHCIRQGDSGSKQSLISLRTLSADEAHQSWPKQFSTRNLGRQTWISIFSCCYVCFCSIKFSYFSGRVFFSTHTHTPPYSVGSAASFDLDFFFFSGLISLSNSLKSKTLSSLKGNPTNTHKTNLTKNASNGS